MKLVVNNFEDFISREKKKKYGNKRNNLNIFFLEFCMLPFSTLNA